MYHFRSEELCMLNVDCLFEYSPFPPTMTSFNSNHFKIYTDKTNGTCLHSRATERRIIQAKVMFVFKL
jgi:hypothetical protein